MTTSVFYPQDDCSNDANTPDTNRDADDYLAVGSGNGDTRYEFFVKFDISILENETISSAKFRFYCYASDGSDPMYIKKVLDDSWVEETLTWNSKPVRGSIIFNGTMGQATSDWYECEDSAIASYVYAQRGKYLSICVDGGRAGHYNFFRDKEYNPDCELVVVHFTSALPHGQVMWVNGEAQISNTRNIMWVNGSPSKRVREPDDVPPSITMKMGSA